MQDGEESTGENVTRKRNALTGKKKYVHYIKKQYKLLKGY